MTENEICTLYRQAKDKSAQITILADLALKKPDEIKEILRAHGYRVDDWSPKNAKRLVELVEQGATKKQMAAEFGVSVSTIYKWLEKIHAAQETFIDPAPKPELGKPPAPVKNEKQERLLRDAAAKCRQSIAAFSRGEERKGCFSLGELYGILVRIGDLVGVDVDMADKRPFTGEMANKKAGGSGMARTKNPNMISPQEAGRLAGCGANLVMYGLRTGQFPVGTAIYNEESERWSYLIPRKAFLDWLENYHKLVPLVLFKRWRMPDGTYVIPETELKQALISKGVTS